MQVTHEEVVELLKINEAAGINEIASKILVLLRISSSSTATKYTMDEFGEIKKIFCYYHKEWEFLSQVPYGAKKSSATGFNTMCKVGVSRWGKQLKDLKSGKEKIMIDLLSDRMSREEGAAELDRLEMERWKIVPLPIAK